MSRSPRRFKEGPPQAALLMLITFATYMDRLESKKVAHRQCHQFLIPVSKYTCLLYIQISSHPTRYLVAIEFTFLSGLLCRFKEGLEV